MARLTEAEIDERLRGLGGWQRDRAGDPQGVSTPGLQGGHGLRQPRGRPGDAADHHPDILIHYDRR